MGTVFYECDKNQDLSNESAKTRLAKEMIILIIYFFCLVKLKRIDALHTKLQT